MARQTREEQVQIDRYATSLFYGAGQERPNQRSATNSFGATYANGQARPLTPMLPQNRPVPKVEPIVDGTNATNLRNDNWRQDQIVLSQETRELRNGSAWSGGGVVASSPARTTGAGNASGPRYSDEFRRTLDALLSGT